MTPTESFISHLIELRNRLLKIVLGFVLVFFALFPFANKIYALLAAPMLAKLPAGGQMIATAIIATFNGTKNGVVTAVAIIWPPAGNLASIGAASSA